MQACIEGGGDRVCRAESKWQTLLCRGGDEGLGWSVVEVRGEGTHLKSSVQGRSSVFHWLSR